MLANLIDYLPLAIVSAPVAGALVAAVQNRSSIIAMVRDLRKIDRRAAEDDFQW